MEPTTLICLILAVLVGAGVAYWMLRRDAGQGQTPSAFDYLARIQEAISVAEALVAAAEQLSETGQIERDARFNYVYSRLHSLFPGLSEDLLVGIIEGAVWVVTKGAELLEADGDR